MAGAKKGAMVFITIPNKEERNWMMFCARYVYQFSHRARNMFVFIVNENAIKRVIEYAEATGWSDLTESFKMEISEENLCRVQATFYAYLLTRKYSKQYRDEIIAEFDRYVEWMKIAPGEEPAPGAKVLEFPNRKPGA